MPWTSVGPGEGDTHRNPMVSTDRLRRSIVDPSRGRVVSVGEWSSPHTGGGTTSTLRRDRRSSDSMTSCSSILPRLAAPSVITHVAKAVEWTRAGKGEAPSPVVIVRQAELSYSRRGPVVLDGLNLTAEAGCIYGLLGASGCGKTSLLSVIVGRRRLNAGLVQVLGRRPRPGHRLGYMPQEVALYSEFTILETLQYFGRLHGLASKEVPQPGFPFLSSWNCKLVVFTRLVLFSFGTFPFQLQHQLEFLTNLLDLPPPSRTVGTLSGGQQRRVSFAVSLLHNPDLLILDEPTVGVDPLLREKVWNHLIQLAHTHGKTVIITTHYIEEARGADRVGFMRAGRLLAEASPSSLLLQHGLATLEEVFLRLCVSHNKLVECDTPERGGSREGGGRSREGGGCGTPTHIDPVVATLGRQLEREDESHLEAREVRCCPGLTNMHALLVKNLLKLRRNPAMLLFVFLLPAIQVVFFCISIGQEPRGLHLGMVNYEPGNCSGPATGCVLEELGCRMFRSDERVTLVQYTSEAAAMEAVREGELWGTIVIQSNFSAGVLARLGGGGDNTSAAMGQVAAHMDMSNQQVGLSLQRWVLETLSNSTASLLSTCRLPSTLLQEPVLWMEPVYGDSEPSFTEFMAPGIIILIIYFLAVALTGESFISERAGGLLERSWVAGVTPGQVLASHILVQFCVMLIQTAVTLTTIILGFSIPCRGPIVWLAVLTMLQGLAGMSFGFLISSLCDSQAVAMQLSIGSFYPNLLLSGILWPLEGMPPALQYIARFLPNTLACQAMRDIMLRGWGVDRPEVYFGLISTSIWIAIFLSASWLVVRIKS